MNRKRTELVIEEIRNKGYKKINVCGSPGSGKSTFAKLLSKKLGIEVYDLDDYLYEGDCQRKSRNATKESINRIIDKQDYIIDGTYLTTFEIRLRKIELVVLTFTPTVTSLFRFFRRLLTKRELKCGERLTIKTLFLILQFRPSKSNWIIEKTKSKNVDLIILK